MREQTWDVVVPVKGGSRAKSRLAVPDGQRAALARALALDAVAATLACAPVVEQVLVVSGDTEVLSDAEALGARAVRERRESGLLAAVADGVAAAGSGPVAVLLADLPSLRRSDLLEALAACSRVLQRGAPSVFVPDLEGAGTVLLAALDAAALRPAFGPRSAAAHARTGAVALELDLPRLRRDVDTVGALDHAVRLGVGVHTRDVLRGGQTSA